MSRFKSLLFLIFIINIALVVRYFYDKAGIQCEPCEANFPCPPCQTGYMSKFWLYFFTSNVLGGMCFFLLPKYASN